MIKITTILTLTLTFGCLAGEIAINPQADHSHVRTMVVVNTAPVVRSNREYLIAQTAKWEEALIISGFNVVTRTKIESIIHEQK